VKRRTTPNHAQQRRKTLNNKWSSLGLNPAHTAVPTATGRRGATLSAVHRLNADGKSTSASSAESNSHDSSTTAISERLGHSAAPATHKTTLWTNLNFFLTVTT
jgi:hypothetical protein